MLIIGLAARAPRRRAQLSSNVRPHNSRQPTMEARKKCLVLMPFAEQYREVYTEVYKPTCARLGLDCWRVDEISRPGSITRDIVEGILDSDVVIADLTSRNANVFYELGIAHSTGNKTIMTVQTMADIPFDIANYRVLVYEQTISGSRKFSRELEKAIQELLAALDRTNNPLQEVLSHRNTIGVRRKAPLAKYIPMADLPGPIRDWLVRNKITYADDVAKIDVRALAEEPGLGKISLGKFFGAIMEHDLYPDAAALQEVITKYSIRTRPNRYGHWS